MPYDPGIKDISGQLLAQGQMQRAEGIAGGLVGWLKGYEQNQNLKNQSMATFSGLMNSDPEFKQHVTDIASGNVNVPEPLKKAIGNLEKGELDVYDASILGNYGQVYQTGKQRRDEQQRSKMQQAATLADVLGKMSDIQYGVDKGYINPELANSLKSLLGGAGGQMQVTPRAAAPAGAVASPAAVAAAIPSQGNLSLEQMTGGLNVPAVAATRFLGAGQPPSAPAAPAVPTAAIRAVAPQVMPQADAQQAVSGMSQTGLRAQAGFDFNAPWSPSNQAGVSNFDQILSELQSNLPPSKRNAPDVIKKAEDIFDRRNKERDRLMQAKEYMPASQPRAIEGGKYLQNYDTRTGEPIGDKMPNPQHPDIAQEVERNRLIAGSTQKIADSDISAGQAARRAAVPIARLSNLIESGQLKTGVGQEWINNARGVAKAFGVSVDENQLAAGNEGIAYFGQLLLPIYEIQKGTVSNSEQTLYKSMTGSMAKDPKANAALLKVMAERASVDNALENNAYQRNKGDIKDREFYDNRERILKEFDDRVKDLAKIGGIDLEGGSSAPSAVAAPASAGAKPQFRWDPVTKKVIPL